MFKMFDCQVREVDSEMVAILLPGDGHEVVVKRSDYQNAVDSSSNATEFQSAIRNVVQASLEDWKQNRGPDSELGRNMEQGTPTTDHSSEGNR